MLLYRYQQVCRWRVLASSPRSVVVDRPALPLGIRDQRKNRPCVVFIEYLYPKTGSSKKERVVSSLSIIGLTGHEPVIETKYQSFCSLCSRLIRRGATAVAVGDEYLIHQECALAKFTEESAGFYREYVRNETTKKTRKQKKKIHEAKIPKVCKFCHRVITPGETYVTEDGSPYHNSGRNSCVVRVRRVVNISRVSLYK